MAKLKQYELNSNAAKHQLKDGTIVKPGEVVESETDLTKTFPNKFTEYGVEKVKPVVNKKKKPVNASKGDEVKDPDDDNDDNDSEVVVDNVVSSFGEEAEAAGIVVIKEGRKYIASDSDGNTLTDGPATKTKTRKAIAEFLEDDEEGEDEE